jgi:hypothetical protein
MAKKEERMLGILLLLLLLILLFGGLGIFVAKVFLFGLIIALLLSLVAGGGWYRGHSHL